MSTLDTSTEVSDHVEALFREARQRRRRRRIVGGALVVAMSAVAIVGLLFAIIGAGGGGASLMPSRSGRPPSGTASLPAQTAPASDGVVGRGPTAIDFSDPSHGWIASGGSVWPQTYNPTILRTTDGGQTWLRTPVPNLGSQTVSAAVNRDFGALVGIHFANSQRGWFLQAGIGWQTNDAGTSWTKIHLPVDGALVALSSAGTHVWALVDTCPLNALSCPQNMGKGNVYYATSAPLLKWQRVGRPLPAFGYGVLYPGAGKSVVVAFGDVQYRRALGKALTSSVSTSCGLVGALKGRAVAGVCDGSGGGNASVSNIAVSSDGGTSWHTITRGPPSTQWMGAMSTNGSDTVFDVTGGQTLWRTSTSMPGWRVVLQAPVGSQEEIYPVYVLGLHGYALIGTGLEPYWYETNDGGVTWGPITLP